MNDTAQFGVFVRRGIYEATGLVQAFYVAIVALVIIVDAVGNYVQDFDVATLSRLVHLYSNTSIRFMRVFMLTNLSFQEHLPFAGRNMASLHITKQILPLSYFYLPTHAGC